MDGLLDGRYRIEAEIARGAIGTVLRATDTQTDATVAIKVLRPEAAQEPELVVAFAAEAAILAELNHPSIVRPHDFVVHNGQHALVMDLVVGEDLRKRVRRDGPVPPAVAANVVAQIADALAYLHGRGIVHGDIKPGNLLVPADGGPVRLADFGVARRVSDDTTDQATHATPEYVAPEVVAGAKPSSAADVYALGIVLFELLSGRSPFRGGEAMQVLSRHGQCAPVPPPGLPPVVWPVIEACLSAEPADRPTARVLAARLRGVEPALDGVPALAPLSPEQVTWWPRPAGATTAVAPVNRAVSWVPLRAAPVSPASAYAGRMVAIPVAGMAAEPGYGPTPPARRLAPEAIPVSPAPISPAGSAPATLLAAELATAVADPVRLPTAPLEVPTPTESVRNAGAAAHPKPTGPTGRAARRSVLAAAVGAAGIAAAAVVGVLVLLLGGAGGGGAVDRRASIDAEAGAGQATPGPTGSPVAPDPGETTLEDPGGQDPSGERLPGIPSGDPEQAPRVIRTPGPGAPIVQPDTGGLPRIGDEMPTMPRLPAAPTR